MPRRRCPVCRSREWHKEPASGLITCSEGHVLQNYRNETAETTDLGPHALKKRTLKSGREKKEAQTKADGHLYHGPRARYHYFQCLQLLLRKQVAFLTQEWKLPPEFEIVCRDVWALHLSLLPRPPPPEPYLHAQERGGEDASNPPEESSKSTDSDDDKDESASSSGSESESTEADPKEAERETLLADLLREASQSESSDDNDPADSGKGKGTTTAKKARNRYEVPAGNIAVLAMACWTMRLPVMYMDLIRLIEAYKLPYLDPVRLLPPEMKRHLAKETVLMLSPHFAPGVLALHGLTSRLARLCWTTYGIQTPEMNAAPLLWRSVRAMGGTSTLYGLTKSMANALSLPLTLHPSLAPALVQAKRKDPRRHKSDNVPPELALIAALIVVLKLVYGLDGTERCAVMATDAACALPRLDDYLATLRGGKGELFSGSHVNTLELDEVDAFLDFAERALLGNDETDKTVGEFFPLNGDRHAEAGRVPEGEVGSREAGQSGNIHVGSKSPVVLASEDSGGVEPGRVVRIFSTLDVLGSVPAAYATVLEAGARFAGVGTEDVAGVVERFERRLVRWAEVERKGRCNRE